MGGVFDSRARKYLAEHTRDYPDLCKRANELESVLKRVLDDASIPVHLVVARAKHPDSVREKIRRKKYKNPSRQITDRIGARIITYYTDDVDEVVRVLRGAFTVNEGRSIDKRTVLDLRSFGYRSVHLIGRLQQVYLQSEESRELKGRSFEIQVRSVLEHAWAEIEHEVVYKSGIAHSDGFRRRFAAIAGTLEVLEREFSALSRQRESLVNQYKTAYDAGTDGRVKLDSARLVALFEHLFPAGLGWRAAKEEGNQFKPHSDALCVEALARVGLTTANGIRAFVRTKVFKAAMARFAKAAAISVDRISHLALSVLIVGCRRRTFFNDFFPDMINDAALRSGFNA